jgi:hypothetical protein
VVDREEDPNGEAGQRQRDREVHRRQLEAVRAAFAARGEGAIPDPDSPVDAYRTEYLVARLTADVRRLDHKQRSTARILGVLAASVVAGALAFAIFTPGLHEGPQALDEISARSIRADRIAVTGDLRLVDAAGNPLAVLGRGLGAAGADPSDRPVVLSLNAEGDPARQLVRIAASKSGARLTLETPTGSSSVTARSTQSGSTVEVREGEETQSFSGAMPAPLPPVAAGPKEAAPVQTAAPEVPAWTPRRGEPARGELPLVRDVGHGFLVADLSARPAAGGVEVRGRMVNTSAVVHNGLGFKITLGPASATLTIPKISPGNSTGFRVTVPGAATDTIADAQVEYLGSTVAFQATSTEPVYGRHARPN